MSSSPISKPPFNLPKKEETIAIVYISNVAIIRKGPNEEPIHHPKEMPPSWNYLILIPRGTNLKHITHFALQTWNRVGPLPSSKRHENRSLSILITEIIRKS